MSHDSQKSKEQKQSSGAGGTLAGILGGATAVGGLAMLVGAVVTPIYLVGATVAAAVGYTAGKNNYEAIFYGNPSNRQEARAAYNYAH